MYRTIYRVLSKPNYAAKVPRPQFRQVPFGRRVVSIGDFTLLKGLRSEFEVKNLIESRPWCSLATIGIRGQILTCFWCLTFFFLFQALETFLSHLSWKVALSSERCRMHNFFHTPLDIFVYFSTKTLPTRTWVTLFSTKIRRWTFLASPEIIYFFLLSP